MRIASTLLLLAAGCRSLFGFDDVSLAPDAPIDAPVDSPCADDDGDGVCDFADACAGHDDAVDSDADGIADGCDAWPCGPEPAEPANDVTFQDLDNGNVTTLAMTNTLLDSQTKRLVVDAAQTFEVTASFSLVDCICPTCLDQVEIGVVVPNATKVCMFDGNPQGNQNCMTPTLGTQTRELSAPATPGQYDVRFALGQDFACGMTNTSWFAGVAPPSTQTIAVICVRP